MIGEDKLIHFAGKGEGGRGGRADGGEQGLHWCDGGWNLLYAVAIEAEEGDWALHVNRGGHDWGGQAHTLRW